MIQTLIITAAGSSTRFEGETHKLLMEWKHKPLLWHSLKAFEHVEWKEVLVTTHPDMTKAFQDIIADTGIPARLIDGGATRQESVKNAVNTAQNCDYIYIHDAARPFIDKPLIQRLIEADASYPAVVPGIPVTDTIKRTQNNMVLETLERDALTAVQTPQRFHYTALLEAYKKVDPSKIDITDEGMLMELAGYPVHIIEGALDNKKVTFLSDLD